MFPIPITTYKGVNCITQNGVTYCEKNISTEKELGFSALSAAGVFLWFIFWVWTSLKMYEKWDICPILTVVLGAYVLPLIVIGLISLF